MKLLSVIRLFVGIFCCALFAYLWGPSISHYSSVFLQEAGSIIKPVGAISLSVIAGFIFLKVAAGIGRD